MKRTIRSHKLASERAIEMLLKKMTGEPFQTEIEVPGYDVVDPAPPVCRLSDAVIALVTEGGIVPKGNPDCLESVRATRFAKYPVHELEKLGPSKFKSIHLGFDTTFINQNPNRLVPADALRELQLKGEVRGIHPFFFVTTGAAITFDNAKRIGREIARELKSAGVSAALITSTCGTGTRCGAIIEKEIERIGIPAVLITSLVPTAKILHANRFVHGIGITNPVGNPLLPPQEEKIARIKLVKAALETLAVDAKKAWQ